MEKKPDTCPDWLFSSKWGGETPISQKRGSHFPLSDDETWQEEGTPGITSCNTGVPSARISMSLSSRIRKYCQVPHGDSSQSSRAMTSVSGTLRRWRISCPNSAAQSSGYMRCERHRRTRTKTVRPGQKRMNSSQDSLIRARSMTIPRPVAIFIPCLIASTGGGPRVIPHTPAAPPAASFPVPLSAPGGESIAKARAASSRGTGFVRTVTLKWCQCVRFTLMRYTASPHSRTWRATACGRRWSGISVRVLDRHFATRIASVSRARGPRTRRSCRPVCFPPGDSPSVLLIAIMIPVWFPRSSPAG